MTPQYESISHLPPPTSDLQDVLFHIIKHGEVSLRNFPMMGGYRTRVSELREKGVKFVEIPSEGLKNRHGHNKVIFLHKCTNINFAVSLYKELKEAKK